MKSPRFKVIVEMGGQKLFSGSRSQCEQYIKEQGLTVEYASSVHNHIYVSGV